jgi:hypothetical protein
MLAIVVGGSVLTANSRMGLGVLILFVLGAATGVKIFDGDGAWLVAVLGAVATALETIANRNNITPYQLIVEHIYWLPSLFQKFRLLINNSSNAQIKELSYDRKQTWAVQLVAFFAHELAEVFPEEWNEWQHWISDMMDDQRRMLEQGKNHRLVSLITFYRLTRFAFYIGIDKVFILATRRTTNKVRKK